MLPWWQDWPEDNDDGEEDSEDQGVEGYGLLEDLDSMRFELVKDLDSNEGADLFEQLQAPAVMVILC